MNNGNWIWTAGAGLFLCSTLAFAWQDDEHDEYEEPVQDGAWLYHRHCSGCHNDNGDGRGETILALGLTARDFRQGAFAFGDSREQLERTLLAGVPGRSPMPSFRGVLDDEQLGLVVDHLRTFMPERDEQPPRNTELLVGERAVIARGKLPAISSDPPTTAGAPEVPRGLLIGTPDGMTFEYDLDGVRLRGARLGRFADREDWGDRGGGYLRPLGQLIWTEQDPDLGFAVLGRDALGFAGFVSPPDQERRLRSTRALQTEAGLSYDILERNGDGSVLATVDELVSMRSLSVGPGIQRSRRVRLAPVMQSVLVEVAGARAGAWRSQPPGLLVRSPGWWVADLGQQGVEAVHIAWQGTELPFVTMPDNPRPSALTIQLRPDGDQPLSLRTTTVRVPAWSSELAEQLTLELNR